MLVPVELKQEIIFFFLSALLTYESRGEDEKKVFTSQHITLLACSLYGDALQMLKESMVEKHSCVGLKRVTVSLPCSSPPSRLQLLPLLERGWNLRADTESDS